MGNFINFKNAMQQHLGELTKSGQRLFTTSVDKDKLWDTYLDAFPEGTNKVFRERREYDCTCCKQFIRSIGNVVAIKDGASLVSIWDMEGLEYPYNVVAEKLSQLVKSHSVADVFLSEFPKIGTDSNKQQAADGTILTWNHFFYVLPNRYVVGNGKSVEAMVAPFRDSKNVFRRSMEELSASAGETLLELIDQGSVYRGDEHRASVQAFLDFKKRFSQVPDSEKDLWCWSNIDNNPVVRVRNSLLGTLLTAISDGEELDSAVFKFNNRMSPENYKRPTAVFSARMVEEAQKKIEELGFNDSLARRYAVTEDITANNVLFVNRNVKKKLAGGSVFDDMKEEASAVANTKAFSKVEEVSVEDFVNNILPGLTSISLLVEGRHQSNLMSLVAPQNREAPSMLKWSNNFSWAYNGDVADSLMKANVKAAGGNVDGVLRFSIQWNDRGDYNPNDFDAHCEEPNGNHIYFGVKGHAQVSSGMLDVDIMRPSNNQVAVENIIWTDPRKMPVGEYKMYVHNYSHNGGRSGFSAEIEFAGQVHQFSVDRELKQGETVHVATIKLDKNGEFSVVKSMDSTMASRTVWGIKTQTFVPVSMCMLSPNHWDGQKGIGNLHYMFILKDCKNEGQPRGFFNEFLKEELTPHRKVFEALGSRMRVEPSDTQLSGLGFSSTLRNSVVAKVEGKFSRTIKINF